MKNITLSADEKLIEAARASANHTTLNEQFRHWLTGYACHQECLKRYDETVAALRGKLLVGRKLTRKEMDER